MTIKMSEPYKIFLPRNQENGSMKGVGARAMGCILYDECLYEAAVKNLDSFNCESCRYEFKGIMECIEPAIIEELEAHSTSKGLR